MHRRATQRTCCPADARHARSPFHSRYFDITAKITKNIKWLLLALVPLSFWLIRLTAQEATPKKPKTEVKTSYMPVVDMESFSAMRERMAGAKPAVMKRQANLLAERYDLSNRPAKDVVMDRSKPVQQGVRVKLPAGVTWSQLGDMTPEQIHDKCFNLIAVALTDRSAA